MPADNGLKATQEILVLVGRAIDGLISVRKPNGVDADGVLINPPLKLASLKAARHQIDQAIAIIERKWPPTFSRPPRKGLA
jgi:hypothetical protein